MIEPNAAATIPTQTLTAAESHDVREAARDAGKVVVAVHGIGDQFRNATIQTVVSAFGRFARYPADMPLGRFRGGSGTLEAFKLRGPPVPAESLSDIGFVEVYWADVPRAAQKEGYIIEESKAWARTVVERVRARFGEYAGDLRARGPDQKSLRLTLCNDDYFAGADAIEEMIETFGVLNNLLFIAEKAGVLKFDLDALLTSYLGDVQIVADFADYRRTILGKFSQVLAEVYKANPDAEIHVVAHSEGTVVAFMGLLQAMCHPVVQPPEPRSKDDGRLKLDANPPEPPGWVRQLRGLMTFGSPIDKHLILWPDIWDDLQTPHPKLADLRAMPGRDLRIPWRNYYDFGDPVGFKLDTARDWMGAHGWKDFFQFDPEHDYGFGRYLLPGAAHNDYWADEAVFGHFIQTVMKLPVPEGGGSHDQPPANKPMKRLGSNVLPYLLVAGILYFAVYLLYKGMVSYITPLKSSGATAALPAQSMREFILNVAGITALLAGMVALARIPRLTRSWKWIGIALGIFLAGALSYAWLVDAEVRQWHAMRIFDSPGLTGRFGEWAAATFPHTPVGSLKETASTTFVIVLAGAIAGFAAWGSRRRLRDWTGEPLATLRPFFVGARPLIVPGAFFVLLIIGYRALNDHGGAHAIWPLILASSAFLYLWWLATLVFDLVFVWHRYIRHSVTQNYLYALRRERKKVQPH